MSMVKNPIIFLKFGKHRAIQSQIHSVMQLDSNPEPLSS